MPTDPTVELWTLYTLGVCLTILRTYARAVAVGFQKFHADDYLIWLAMIIYTAQCSLGHSVGAVARGLANNGMTDAQRSALPQNDPEYTWRIIGSKIQVAGWTTAACLLWTLKLCMTFFYLRLTNGLHRYQTRIYVAMGLIITTFTVVVLTIYLSCRPFHHYWQIYPDPGTVCQAAISKPILWVSFVSNVSTDMFLLLIPVPMLWRSSLRTAKKIAATLVLSAGVLVIICAVLKSIHVIVDPINGGQLAAAWGTRETFIAIATTNLPMIFPILKVWLGPYLPSTLWSSSNSKAYKTPRSGFLTIGGGGGDAASSRNRQGSQTNARHTTDIRTLENDSEEQIFTKNDDLQMLDMPTAHDIQRSSNAIVVSKQVSITTEDRFSKRSAEPFQQV